MNESSEQQLKNFIAIAELQDELLALNFRDESALSAFTQKLLLSPLLDSKWTFRSVLVSIYTCFLSRQHSDFDYINLFIEIAKNPKNTFTSDDYIFNLTNKFFIYQLYKAGLINIKSIYEESSRSNEFLLYFYPEIKEYYPNSPLFKEIDFSDVQQAINSSGYQYDAEDKQSYLNKFIELRSKGKNPDIIALSIRDDDIEQFQQLLYQTNTSINSVIQPSIFERFIFINQNSYDIKPSLIEYAAFFGSLKCFKFLYQKQQDLPQTTAIFAVAGGNYEIIHLCEQRQIEFNDESLMISIRFFHSELTEYLEENFDIKKTADDVSKSLVFYNLHALIDCESVIRENPNMTDSSGYSALSLASLNGDLDIINYLIQTFGSKIDLNRKNEYDNSALYYAAGHGHYEVVVYLSKLPNIDLNLENHRKQTALHFAASKGHFNIVKYLCSLKDVDINADCGINVRPIDNAVENGHLEIVSFLANLDGAVVYVIDSLNTTSILQAAALSKRIDVVEFVWELIMKALKKLCVDDVENFMKTNEAFNHHKQEALLIAFLSQENEIKEFLKSH